MGGYWRFWLNFFKICYSVLTLGQNIEFGEVKWAVSPEGLIKIAGEKFGAYLTIGPNYVLKVFLNGVCSDISPIFQGDDKLC